MKIIHIQKKSEIINETKIACINNLQEEYETVSEILPMRYEFEQENIEKELLGTATVKNYRLEEELNIW